MSESHQREAAIFDAAMELPPEQRAACLDQACGDDAALRQRLEALLKAGDSRCAFLDPPTDPALCQKPGDRIGRYKLLEQIGEGGCGVVYVAEQTEPVRRRVALKIIKLGMDTRSVIARFEAERQALALMDHPNIAKVFDAGTTETGRPYFVMELVRGMKITDYCDEKKLSTRARLGLFIQVCQAIQHAHQKGIIHRDIKPSNIMVTMNDGVAVPKVIDFGVAKATGGQQLTDKTVFTAFEQFIGTPAYMSPEQAVLTSLDIDTRSDIYALGVLLYELLTGQTPFDAKELLAIGLDEMRRTIQEKEPDRPSTRVSTLPGQELSTTAQRRGLEAPKLVSELRGDLDWIVMKCLEKDRARRYETANGLASDIERHLNNEPVVACPPGRLYRFQKMVRRNKLAFAAGSAVAMSLVIGLTLSTVLFFRERAARERADEQTAIAQAVNDFLQKDLLRQASSFSQAEAHFLADPNLTVREALERAAERIGDRFKDQPLEEAAVRFAIGSALDEIGEAERAIGHLQQALEVRRARLGPDDPDTLKSMGNLAKAYLRAGKFDQALPLFEQAIKLWQARPGPHDRDTLISMNNLAETYRAVGKLDQALPLYEETLKLSKARLGPDDRATLESMDKLAGAYCSAGKLDQALPLSEETLKLSKARLGPDDPLTLRSMNVLANVYLGLGKFDQALALYQETLKHQQARLGPDHPDTLWTMNNVACAYLQAGKVDQALALTKETLKLVKAKLGPDNPMTLYMMRNLATTYGHAGNHDEALALIKETLKLSKEKLGPNHPNTLASMQALGSAYAMRDKFDQALPLLEETLKLKKDSLGLDHPETLASMRILGVGYLYAGKLDQAQALLKETLELQRARLGPDHPETLTVMNSLAQAYADAGQFDQALPLFEETLKLRKTRLGPDHPDTLHGMVDLASAYVNAGKADQGLPLADETVRLVKAGLGTNLQPMLVAMQNLAIAYKRAGKLDQAVPLFEETLKRWKARGLDNPETLEAMDNLALAYVAARKPDEALPVFEETLRLRQARLGPDDRSTLKTMSNLASAYVDAGRLQQALPLFEETVKLMRAKLGPDDSFTQDTIERLGVAYATGGQPAQALPLFAETLKLRKARLGPDHPATLQAMNNLAIVYRDGGKLAEVEALFRDRLAEVRQRAANDPSKLEGPVSDLVEALVQQHKCAEAEQLFDDVLTPTVLNQPASAGLLRSRGTLRARRGEFAQAAGDLSKAREFSPDDHEMWHDRAPLLVASHQLDLYRDQCRLSLEHFGNTTNPTIAERIAKDCLMLPASGADLDIVAKMADTAVAATNHTDICWFQFVKGLAEYRQGHFAKAVEWMDKALTDEGKAADRDVEAYMVLAMAYDRLNQTEEARNAFAKGTEIEQTKLPKLESGYISGNWLDWIVAHALMREAGALMEGETNARAEAK